MNRLSACLITLNEEHNLPRVLNSIQGIAEEIVVVDCGSDDRTLDIAREYGAKVLTHPWSNFGAQKNRSEEHTSELQSRLHLVCRLLLEKKKKSKYMLI